MEAKEKAYDIFNKCCDYADYTDEDCCFTERETMYKNAKSLALIMINEIIENNRTFLDGLRYHEILNRLEEIKVELESIEICDNNLLKYPKKYTEKHLKYAYEQGKLSHNPCYYRSFENVISMIENKAIRNES